MLEPVQNADILQGDAGPPRAAPPLTHGRFAGGRSHNPGPVAEELQVARRSVSFASVPRPSRRRLTANVPLTSNYNRSSFEVDANTERRRRDTAPPEAEIQPAQETEEEMPFDGDVR